MNKRSALEDISVSGDTQTFSAVYTQDADWWVGFVQEVPGAMSQGETLDKCRANLQEAVSLMLDVYREDLAQELEGRTLHQEAIIVARP